MLRFYVLTSRNLKCLKRHFASLPRTETTVVINTTLDWYREEAAEWCARNKIDYVVTKSNGYPGRGKNSVIQHFLASEYDYMVQIDGDDFLQPHGVNLYRAISASAQPPDGVVILHSLSWSNNRKIEGDLWLPNPFMPDFEKEISKYFDACPEIVEKVEYFRENKKELKRNYVQHCKDNDRWNFPGESRQSMDCARLIFYSRRLAELVTFRENLMIGEDSLVNYQVRDLAYKGLVELQKINDVEEHSYIYDLQNSGIVKRLTNRLDWDWVKPLNDAILEESWKWSVTPEFRVAPVAIEIEKAPEFNLGKL